MKQTDVTVLGAGLMGAAVVRALLDRNHSVTVWNRTVDKALPLQELGAQIAPTAVEAIGASPVTLLVIKSYDAVHEVLRDAHAAGVAGDVINLVTGEARDADRFAGWVDELGFRALDGVIMAFPGQIGAEDVAFFCAGHEDVWSTWSHVVLQLAGGSAFLGETMRLANSIDSTILSFVTAAEVAALESIAFGQALGLPLEMVTETLMQVPQSLTNFLAYAGRKLAAGSLTTDQATIDTWVESSRMVAASARSEGLPAGQIHSAAATIRAAQDAGLGELDLLALAVRELEHASTAD